MSSAANLVDLIHAHESLYMTSAAAMEVNMDVETVKMGPLLGTEAGVFSCVSILSNLFNHLGFMDRFFLDSSQISLHESLCFLSRHETLICRRLSYHQHIEDKVVYKLPKLHNRKNIFLFPENIVLDTQILLRSTTGEGGVQEIAR